MSKGVCNKGYAMEEKRLTLNIRGLHEQGLWSVYHRVPTSENLR